MNNTPMSLAPEVLAHRYSVSQDAIMFVAANRQQRVRAPFLIDRELDVSHPTIVTRAQAMSVCPSPAPLHFIFHSAFCCSTLLANAFDLPGVATSLKEPMILNDLIGWRRKGGIELLPQVTSDVMRLLARPFEEGEAVVVKPSNLINEHAPMLMSREASARAIFIEAPLIEFVTSIAGKGLEGRSWARELFVQLAQADLIHVGIDPKDYLMLTDLQIAAVGWVAQHHLFAELTRREPSRYRWINSSNLLDRPTAAVEAAYRFFGLNATSDDVALLVAREFARNSKDGRAFSVDDRRRDQAGASAGNADEIEKVTVWAEKLMNGIGLPLVPVAPLL